MPDPIITSVHNPRVKDAVRLRAARHRRKQGRFLIDGARELVRAAAAGAKLVEVFVCEPLCQSPESLDAIEALRHVGVELMHVSAGVFAKLAFGERAEGVLGVAETPTCDLATLKPHGSGPIAVLEGVEKPGNVGAVLRSADAAGVAAVIVADPGTDLYNPNCIRASLGTLFTVPVCTATAAATLQWLRDRHAAIYAARVDAQLPYSECDLSGDVALVLGSEAEGLSTTWHAADVKGIRLPMRGVVDSLNVSATAAILFYEALRQRSSKAD